MHAPPDQRAVGSPRSLAPMGGLDVELPRSPVRGAAARHSQEATQLAPSSPSPMQQDTPPRLSQKQTQTMELTPTPTKDKGSTGKTPLRHSQENTQPAISQLAELYTQYRERRNNEEELITELLTVKVNLQLPVRTSNHRCWSLWHRPSTSKLGIVA